MISADEFLRKPPYILYVSPIFSIICASSLNHRSLMGEILTVREIAVLLKINEKTAYKLTAMGEIPGFKVGGSWRFDRRELESWIKRRTKKPGRMR